MPFILRSSSHFLHRFFFWEHIVLETTSFAMTNLKETKEPIIVHPYTDIMDFIYHSLLYDTLLPHPSLSNGEM